ncbi:hypothetical protein NEHOM01_0319 [Nematocida homosporus]|uniref:uncharacterized protein n=1 Tax=Nematocida homosporus TaxID=1912981 RepID=UPI002220B3BD|nr:uncharacterized protein NEHOM01_0319 [Nematocida homosporus]KAI5184717.1 hypothetical protein NEHOM01_0319 [Nematocida homosporus]
MLLSLSMNSGFSACLLKACQLDIWDLLGRLEIRDWAGVGWLRFRVVGLGRLMVSLGVSLVFVLLLAVGGVSGTSGIEEGYTSVRTGNGPSDLENTRALFNALESVGVIFARYDSWTRIQHYVYDRSTEPILNLESHSVGSNDFLLNIPRYTVECVRGCVSFELQSYRDVEAAQLGLKTLRMFAVIRARSARLTYKLVESNCPQVNMQILSRVFNMLDCVSIELAIESSALNVELSLDHLDAGLCWEEAWNTAKHAKIQDSCCLGLTGLKANKCLNLLNVGFVALRPIKHVSFRQNDFQFISLLRRLSLTTHYSLSFVDLPVLAELDFNLLSTMPMICDKINIQSLSEARISIVGLENATAKHANLVLEMTWMLFFYLCLNNRSLIRVHGITGFYVNLESLLVLDKKSLPREPVETKIIVGYLHFFIGRYRPCKALSYYSQFYTRKAFSRYGVSVSDIQIEYEPGRSDLDGTLQLFTRLMAIPEMPVQVEDGLVVCSGIGLSGPSWTITKHVIVHLHHRLLNRIVSSYRGSVNSCFCQHITYKDLAIRGTILPARGQVRRCLTLLGLFQNIVAQRFRIINVNDVAKPNHDFAVSILHNERAKKPKYRLNAAELVLDNVSRLVLYWVFAHYVFVDPIEIYLLNMYFRNLAIAQVLSLKLARNITGLMVNSFLGLNEVKYYKKKDQIKGFSLYRYVAAMEEQGYSLDELGLPKLSIQMNVGYLNSFSDVLLELWESNLLPRVIPFMKYISNTLSPSTIVVLNEITLYMATILDLNADLQRCLSQPAQWSDPLVTNLFLHFSDAHVLTEADLFNILRWVACRFSNLTHLLLANLTVPATLRPVLQSRDYLVRGLDSLKSIQIEMTMRNPDSPTITLPVRPYRVSLLANTPNTVAQFTAVASKTLSYILSHLDGFGTIIPRYVGCKASLEMVIERLKKQGADVRCPVCLKDLYLPSSPGLVDIELDPNFDPDNSFTGICYSMCGHPLCAPCAQSIQIQDSKTCPLCRNESLYDSIHQLVSLPLSSFVFVETNNKVALSDFRWLRAMAWSDNRIYFYLTYKNIANLEADFERKEINSSTHQVYVI